MLERLSAWNVYQNRGITALLVFIFGAMFVLKWLEPTIGENTYFLSLGSVIVIYVVLTMWQVRKIFPAGGIGATSEKVISLQTPTNRSYAAAVQAVKDCGWTLIETKPETGYLKAKIGRSIKALYGQLFTITVQKVSEESSSVKTQCSVLYQTMDYGRNDGMIEKFNNKLQECINGKC